MIDIEQLASPVSGDDPVGENTEYTELPALERLFSPTTPGEDPDWREISKKARELLGKTKDLRVAAYLTSAELALNGLVGLAQGLRLTARLVDDFWAHVYPQLDASDDNDSTERRNALAYFNAPTEFINSVRRATLVESRAVGRYTGRDLEMVLGRLPIPEGVSAPTAELLNAAWQSGDASGNSERADAVTAALGAIADIERTFRREASSHPQPDFTHLRQTLKRIQEFFQKQAGPTESSASAPQNSESPAVSGAATSTAAILPAVLVAGQSLASRGDAIRQLQQVSEFLRKIEPSSPAPMFVDRAVKLLQMDFTAIVKELMPDSKERIELLGGISLDPPESSDSN